MSFLRKDTISSFSLHGYTLRKDALHYITDKLEPLDKQDQTETVQKVLDYISKQSLLNSMIETSLVEAAFSSLESSLKKDNVLFKVHDAFSLLRYTYNPDSKKFHTWSTFHNGNTNLHGDADSKINMMIEKYKTIHQRAARHKLFAAPAISTSSNEASTFKLKAVEHLIGSSKEGVVIILGMLTQLKEGQFYLEDPTGVVRLNLSKATYKGGLFMENNIVLAEGIYEDSVFVVSAVGFPPPEPASVTLAQFPNLCVTPFDVLSTSPRLSHSLKAAEEANGDAMCVFLSDVWLDQLKVMQKLQVLFAGYSQMPPLCFVLIGNFLSLSTVGSQNKLFEDCFSKLGTLISDFPTLLEQSQFIFVPGPQDPGLPHILPRPPIPSPYLGDFLKKVPRAVFTSNPCHIQYCTQDIVVFREDVISKMCRNSIYTPWQHEEKVDIPSLFVKTVIANSHLLPLPPNVAPVYWEFDHALSLYPLPDVVVCADKYDPYTVTSSECLFFNPGSLPRSNFSFKVYFPSVKQVEDSEISDDMS